jgi:hypothetical protein
VLGNTFIKRAVVEKIKETNTQICSDTNRELVTVNNKHKAGQEWPKHHKVSAVGQKADCCFIGPKTRYKYVTTGRLAL